jgi:hypothetical protein
MSKTVRKTVRSKTARGTEKEPAEPSPQPKKPAPAPEPTTSGGGSDGWRFDDWAAL